MTQCQTNVVFRSSSVRLIVSVDGRSSTCLSSLGQVCQSACDGKRHPKQWCCCGWLPTLRSGRLWRSPPGLLVDTVIMLSIHGAAAGHTSALSCRILIIRLNDADRADRHACRLQPVTLAERQLLRRVQVYCPVRHEAAPRPATKCSTSCLAAQGFKLKSLCALSAMTSEPQLVRRW